MNEDAAAATVLVVFGAWCVVNGCRAATAPDTPRRTRLTHAAGDFALAAVCLVLTLLTTLSYLTTG